MFSPHGGTGGQPRRASTTTGHNVSHGTLRSSVPDSAKEGHVPQAQLVVAVSFVDGDSPRAFQDFPLPVTFPGNNVSGRGGKASSMMSRIHVRNLPTLDSAEEFFFQWGNVLSLRQTGEDIIVQFSAPWEAHRALAELERAQKEGWTHFKDSLPLTGMLAEQDPSTQRLLFVGQLGWHVERSDLLKLFAPYGVVDIVFNPSGDAGCKRSALVLFSTLHGATAATALHRSTFGGSAMIVDFARKGTTAETLPKLFVGQLPKKVTEGEVRSILEQYGDVGEVAVKHHPDRPAFAFVDMYSLNQSHRAVHHLHRTEWQGASLCVRLRRTSETKKRRG
jgi:hypothetical protein